MARIRWCAAAGLEARVGTTTRSRWWRTCAPRDQRWHRVRALHADRADRGAAVARWALGVVWTLEPGQAERVRQLDDAAYLARCNAPSAGGWARLQQVGQRQSYPLRLTRADTIVAPRTVLVGNAAQGLHPVAGRGFNLGLRDAVAGRGAVRALAASHGGRDGFDCGAAAGARHLRRAPPPNDRDGVTRFTDGLVKLFADERPGFGAARDLGLLLFDPRRPPRRRCRASAGASPVARRAGARPRDRGMSGALTHDVVIVGGRPVGATLGALLARRAGPSGAARALVLGGNCHHRRIRRRRWACGSRRCRAPASAVLVAAGAW